MFDGDFKKGRNTPLGDKNHQIIAQQSVMTGKSIIAAFWSFNLESALNMLFLNKKCNCAHPLLTSGCLLPIHL